MPGSRVKAVVRHCFLVLGAILALSATGCGDAPDPGVPSGDDGTTRQTAGDGAATTAPGAAPTAAGVEDAFAYGVQFDTGEIWALDPDSGDAAVITTVGGPRSIRAAWFVKGELWVALTEEVVRIDATGEALGVFDLEGVGHLVSDADAVWVEGGPVSAPPRVEPFFSRLDPATNTVANSIHREVLTGEFGNIADMVMGNGSLWISYLGTEREMEIDRIDPETLEILGTTITEIRPFSLAWGEGSLWAVGTPRTDLDEWMLVEIGSDGIVRAQLPISDVGEISFTFESVRFGLGGIWMADQQMDQVIRFDPVTGTEVARVDFAGIGEIGNVHIARGRVWVEVEEQLFERTLFAIDPQTNEATPMMTAPEDVTMFVFVEGDD